MVRGTWAMYWKAPLLPDHPLVLHVCHPVKYSVSGGRPGEDLASLGESGNDGTDTAHMATEGVI